ncbi:MAG: glycosyltransferase [Myxococcota bacterium]|nr:glycosyltransferase [Myxococcota bacterium]
MSSIDSRALSVLLVSHGFPSKGNIGGTELYTLHLARQLSRRGIHACVLYPILHNNPLQSPKLHWTSESGVNVLQCHLPEKQSFLNELHPTPLTERLHHEILQGRFDVIHFQHFTGGIGPALARKLLGGKQHQVYLTLHDAHILCEQNHFMQGPQTFCDGPSTATKCAECFAERFEQPSDVQTLQTLSEGLDLRLRFMRAVTAQMQGVFVPTRFLESALEQYGFSNSNRIRRPLGLAPFSPLPPQPRTTTRFTFLGNLNPTKGADLLIEAFGRLGPQDAELHLHGANHIGPNFEALLAQLSTLRIFYHGPYSPEDLPRILSQSDVGVVPSRSDNFPTVVREFFHAGVPVLASDAGGIPELVKHGVNGRLFESNNSGKLGQELLGFLQNPAWLQSFRANIQPPFTMEEDAHELEEIYRQGLTKPPISPQPNPNS